MGGNRVPKELPSPTVALWEGKAPGEALCDRKLGWAEEPWPQWGISEETMPSFFRFGEKLQGRAVRTEDRGGDGDALEGPGVLPPWPGALEEPMGRGQGNLLGAEVEGTARGWVRAEVPGSAHVHPSGPRGTRGKASKLTDSEVPVILSGKGEDAPHPGLGKVVGGLLPTQGDAIPHSPKEVADRVKPLWVLEEGPDTFQDHETRPEEPKLDEM